MDVKGDEKGSSRTFVEIVFFAACWVTGVHDDGDVLIFGGEGSESESESESEIRKKKRLGASDDGKEKKSILIPCRNLDELVQKALLVPSATHSHTQPHTWKMGKCDGAI